MRRTSILHSAMSDYTKQLRRTFPTEIPSPAAQASAFLSAFLATLDFIYPEGIYSYMLDKSRIALQSLRLSHSGMV